MLNSPEIARRVVVCILALLILVSCNGSPSAARAVEGYYRALVAKDLNEMIGLSCAAWEEQARLEYDSFAAVQLELDNLVCQQAGGEGDQAQVTCTGSLIANYGAEQLEIDIEGRTFQVVNEGGEWRMCGGTQ
jgi:hypothetical protein